MTTRSPASGARSRRTTGTTSSGRATPARSTARRRSSRSIVFARGLPDKLHTRIYLPDDEAAARRRRAALLARRGRARYAHRDAHACGRPPPRHPAARREGDRVPCLLTIRTGAAMRRRRGRPAVAGDGPHPGIGSDAVVPPHSSRPSSRYSRAPVGVGAAPSMRSCGRFGGLGRRAMARTRSTSLTSRAMPSPTATRLSR